MAYKIGQYSKTEFNANGAGRLLVKEYSSVSEASKETGVARSSIYACCYGKLKTAGGFRWSFR